MCVRLAAVGVVVGYAVGADADSIEAGLWGYNPVLGAIAVGVRTPPSRGADVCTEQLLSFFFIIFRACSTTPPSRP
jgi:urea transporter